MKSSTETCALISFALAVALAGPAAVAAPHACGAPKCEKKVINGNDCQVCKTVMCDTRPLPGGGSGEVIVGSSTTTSCTAPQRPGRSTAGSVPGASGTFSPAPGIKSPRDPATGVATGRAR